VYIPPVVKPVLLIAWFGETTGAKVSVAPLFSAMGVVLPDAVTPSGVVLALTVGTTNWLLEMLVGALKLWLPVKSSVPAPTFVGLLVLVNPPAVVWLPRMRVAPGPTLKVAGEAAAVRLVSLKSRR
jgi:hypothetical protein